MKCGYLRKWSAAVIVFIILIDISLCFDYCTTPCMYKKQTRKHTMCIFPKEVPGTKCKAIEQGKDLTEEDKHHLVKIHNELRSKVAEGKESRGNPGPQPPAANMMELVWDKELELIAKRWALQCDYNHDLCRTTKDRSYAGQNLAVSQNSAGFQNDLELQVVAWYDEVELTPKNTANTLFVSTSSDSGDIGHYTQLVWAQTRRVGCARVFFDFSDWGMTEYLVCNYAPGGNVMHQLMYKSGKPCSACEEGTKCSTKYRGLCGVPSGKPSSGDKTGSHDKTGDLTSGADAIHWKFVLFFPAVILVAVTYLPHRSNQ